MALSYRSTQVAAPTAAPTSSATGGTFQVVHRRVNLDGQVSLWSPPRTGVGLPTTLTPQSYGDPGQLLRDEFLISDDAGVTFRVVPRPSNATGALTVASFVATWAIGVNADNQESFISSLNFGTFSSSQSPFKEIYVHNAGLPLNSLTVNFTDLSTNQVASEYSGLIRIELLGVFQEAAQNPSTAFNTSIIWQTPGLALNSLRLLLATGGFAKIRVTLQNFPTGGLSQTTVQLSAQVVGDQRVFPLGFSHDWPQGSLLLDASRGFTLPLVLPEANHFNIRVKPFLVALDGVLVGLFADSVIGLGGITGSHTLTINNQGSLQAWGPTDTVPSSAFRLATFTVGTLSPFITDVQYPWPVKPNAYGFATPSSVSRGRFVTFNASGQLVHTTDAALAVGVSLDDSGLYGSAGQVWVESNATVAIGDRLGPTTGGQASVSSTGLLLAVSAVTGSGFVLAEWVRPQGGSSIDLSGDNPLALGTAAPGVSPDASRADHVHPMPTLNAVAPATADVSLGTQRLTNVGTPTSGTDAATKGYVDAIAQGLSPKASCRAATTANITLSGLQTIDGVSLLAGDRVLIKDQTTATQNGIYTVAAGTWTRAEDFNADPDISNGAFTWIKEGTTQADSQWVLLTDDPIVLGTTALTFTQASGAGNITAGNGLSKTGNQLDVGTASSSRIVVNSDNIDLATVAPSDSTGSATDTFIKSVTRDTWGRVTGVISAVVQAASTTVAGIVQLNNSLTSTSTTQAATANAVKLVNDAVLLRAPLASPALTGTPTGPTAATTTDSTQLATTQFVTRNRQRLGTGRRLTWAASSPQTGVLSVVDLNANWTVTGNDSGFVSARVYTVQQTGLYRFHWRLNLVAVAAVNGGGANLGHINFASSYRINGTSGLNSTTTLIPFYGSDPFGLIEFCTALSLTAGQTIIPQLSLGYLNYGPPTSSTAVGSIQLVYEGDGDGDA